MYQKKSTSIQTGTFLLIKNVFYTLDSFLNVTNVGTYNVIYIFSTEIHEEQ